MTALLLGHSTGMLRVDLETRRGRAVLEGPRVMSVAVDRGYPGRAYAATWHDGLWRSDDDGMTWRQCAAAAPGQAFARVAVTPQIDGSSPATVYVGTEPSAVLRSDDGGSTFAELDALQDVPSRPEWSFPPRPNTSHVWTIAIDPYDPDIVHVGIELGGVISTFDGGRSWRDRQPGADTDCHTLKMHRLAPGRIYEAGGACYCESADQGATWVRDLDGIPEELRYFYSLAVDPGDPDTLVLTASRDPFHGHHTTPPERAWGTAYRRTAQNKWQQLTNGFPAPEGTAMGWFVTDEVTAGLFHYVTPQRRIFASVDGAANWTEIDWDSADADADVVVRWAESTVAA